LIQLFILQVSKSKSADKVKLQQQERLTGQKHNRACFFEQRQLWQKLKISGSICDPLETLNQKFPKSGTFWKRNSNVSIDRRVKV